MKKICICIPVYKEVPSEDEILSLNSVKTNAAGIDIFYIKPRSLDLTGYGEYSFDCVYFEDKYFRNVHTYSRLLLSTVFYEKFIDYEYMLICQTDALLLKPFEEWECLLEEGYD